MGFVPGERFGSYEVAEIIGVGGMGEVYRARDLRLERDVALKILPDANRLDREAMLRFEREARVLAALNHPNIATLHGIETDGGTQALVMELVDGDTLAERLEQRSKLALADVLHVARQIADALDAAHERGVVHRDLKPANVKIRPDGTVKVLDFGIAKVLDIGAGENTGATQGITALHAAIVGTPSYMSPEQAAGGSIDKRADIWAFGCVLYEMLTGGRAFEGETASATIARIIEREPDWGRLPADLPRGLRVLLRQCLEKNPRKRRRDIGDVRLDLDDVTAVGRDAPVAARSKAWMALAAVLALSTAALLALQLAPRPAAPSAAAVRLSVLPPAGAAFATSLSSGSGAPVGGNISPDGSKLAFTARSADGTIRLYVRDLDALEARALPGTEDAALPFWSPDGNALGFFASGQLKRVDASGREQPQVLCPVTRGQGGTWSANGTIVFAANLRTGLRRTSATGGDCTDLTELAAGELAHRFPHFLPDGEHFVYHVEANRPDAAGIFVATLSEPAGRHLVSADSAAFAPPQNLLFVRQGTLLAQTFDTASLALVGSPVPLASGVSAEGSAPAFSASDNGVLTYRAGPSDSEEQQLAWFDRSGTRLSVVGPPGTYRGIDLSPDGTRIAVHDHQADGGDIWVIEPQGTRTRVTFDGAQDNSSPVWSPDGRRLAYGSLRNGKWGLYARAASGEGLEQLFLESEVPKIPASWSSDGKQLAYWAYDSVGHQWVLPLDGGASRRILDESAAYDGHSQISPDGRWLAYMSSSTGGPQVYVRAFPTGEGARQISTSGGLTPRWRSDGKELYYVTSYDHGTLMATTVESDGATPTFGPPQPLFTVDMAIVPHSTLTPNFHTYAVTPDGERFVFPLPVSTLRAGTASAAITVVLNWSASLGR